MQTGDGYGYGYVNGDGYGDANSGFHLSMTSYYLVCAQVAGGLTVLGRAPSLALVARTSISLCQTWDTIAVGTVSEFNYASCSMII